jgi:S-adenosylmethionine-diacylglycerol 3-amino-3-carboxypropyl transferase
MPSFFSRLSYSLGNEDWETEKLALQVCPGNNILCVTGSGDRALHCLLTGAAEVIAIDANPLQNHLLELKAAALRQLDFDDYLGFLGAVPSAKRMELLPKVSAGISAAAAGSWTNKKAFIAAGVLYQGYIERCCAIVANVIGKLRGKKVERLFEATSLEEQRSLVDSEWNSWSWRKAFDLAFHPRLKLAKRWVQDPGLHEQLAPRMHVGRYLYQRIDAYLHRGLARESIIMSLFLLGKARPECFPPYLTPSGWQQIRTGLDRLKVRTQDIVEYLRTAPECSIDRFSLSDIASYMSPRQFGDLARELYRCAQDGARFCIRQFLSDHPLPAELSNHTVRDHALEKELEQRDRCFVYRYIIGTIRK